ncbi:MAG: diaminopimelate decarboxylase [Chitinispirillales bacterium]|jgi:diaminopimelate decarboxylase|nr:diaminopimelate decarboxylase [Chitinispirillales bacterium]
MTKKTIPFSKGQIDDLNKKEQTPFYIYEENGIVENLKNFKNAFSWIDFKEFFAVKATPNPYILKLLKNYDIGADCSSMAELVLAQKSGVSGENIIFTSNNTPADEFKKASQLGAIINFDDISHIKFYEQNAGKLPERVSFRYNPGNLKSGNSIIGDPISAKYGFTKKQLFDGYEYCKNAGVKKFGLHAMVASNELNADYFVETAKILFEEVLEISKKIKISFEFVNFGGGIGIPYHPEQKSVDLQKIGDETKKLYEKIIIANGLSPLKIFMECGRMITGPFGYLVSKVLHKKSTYKEFIGLDACMANLMRPALYGAYHHISILGKENFPNEIIADITGSLCENNDKFAIDRKLPKVEIGDIFVIHDAGAHGHSMGFNYNGKLRCAEFLMRENGDFLKIRRAETIEDLFATLDFENLETFK